MSELEQEGPANPDVARTLGVDAAETARARRRLLLLGGAGAVVALALLALLLRPSGNGIHYATEPARKGDLTVLVTATGTLQPTNQVDVGSELSGTIRTVSADFNDTVKIGQELARLDTTKLESQVLQSRAALESARAKVAQAEASLAEAEAQIARFKQVRELSGGKVPSQADFDAANATLLRARADVSNNKASVTQAQATLDGQLTDLSKASIKSPINGIVLVRSVEPGQTVAASLQAPILFTLAEDLTRMELHVQVDEADVGQVTEGQISGFTVDAWPDRRFQAVVQQVRYGAQTLEGVVTYETVLQVDNSERLLRPGMTATAEITVKEVKDSLLVPNAALRFTPPQRAEEPQGGLLSALMPMRRFGARPSDANERKKQSRVYKLEDGHTVPIDVTIGPSDGTWTVLKKGDVAPDMPLVVDATVRR